MPPSRTSQQSKKHHLIHTFSGLRIQFYLLIASILTTYFYAYLNHTRIHDEFIIWMLRAFVVFGDFGVFLTISYLVDFKRGTVVVYAYKVLAYLSLKEEIVESQWSMVWKIVGVGFGLGVYYKILLFLLMIVAGYMVEMGYDQQIERKMEEQDRQKQQLLQQEKQQNQKLFSKQQRREIFQHHQPSMTPQQQLQQTITRIKTSLRYHTEIQLYQRLQIFFFILYNSTVLFTLFPIQQHLIDFTKMLSLDKNMNIVSNAFTLNQANEEILWYVRFMTVCNVVCFWGVVIVGEFIVKRRYPQLIKEYVLSVPGKFVAIQAVSLLALIFVLYVTPLQQITSSQTQQISLISLISPQTFIACFSIHTFLPLLITFFLFRLYLGHVYTLNKLVSIKFNYHQNSDDAQSNLDSMFYQCITQEDLTKVRHFVIAKEELIPRHKLKRYTEQQKLKHYVDDDTIIEVQSLFEDFLILDLYNKLSRFIGVWMFYLALVVFLIGMNVNDTCLLVQDKFFVKMPVVMLLIGLLIVGKYGSRQNLFYPKIVIKVSNWYSEFLSYRKAYNFIRMTHFYAILFGIWLYRVYSQIFLPTHESMQQKVKLQLYEYYTSQTIMQNSLMTKMLKGWSTYFVTNSAECDYGLGQLAVDTMMITLIIAQVMMYQYFVDHKSSQKSKKWDPLMIVLKIVTPLYALYVFLIKMECLQWSRVVFCVCVIVGVMFMSTNLSQLERGVVRNDEGEYDD